MLLLNAYKKVIPRYRELVDNYEASFKTAENHRKKSSFPVFDKWTPTALEDGDSELLCIPTNAITSHKHITVEHHITHRVITYTSSETENDTEETKHFCSYVRILDNENETSPLFGHIKFCFTHTFAGRETQFALLSLYADAQKDPESGLW